MSPKVILTLAVLAVPCGTAAAQYPYSPSGYGSPYKPSNSAFVNLNLLRPGASPAFNYVTLVRPQLQAINNIQALQGQVNTVQQSVTGQEQSPPGAAPPSLPVTGQPVGFQTQKTYFMNLAGGGTGAPSGVTIGGAGAGSNVGAAAGKGGKKGP